MGLMHDQQAREEIVWWESLQHDYSIWHFIRYQKTADLVNRMEGRSVLDIGCGIGLQDFLISNKAVIGIDTNSVNLEEARRIEKRSLKENDGVLGFVMADLHSLPFREKFDLIVCTEVLEHLGDDAAALKAVAYSLKEGGSLILTVPNATRFDFPHVFALGRDIKRVWRGHVREYSLRDVYGLVNVSSLKMEKMGGIYLDFPLFHLFNISTYASGRPSLLPPLKIRSIVYKALNEVYRRFWRPLEVFLCHRTYYFFVILKKVKLK